MRCDKEQLKAILADSRYIDIGNLPSNFLPYKSGPDAFDKLYIRPFTVQELKLVSMAAALKEMKHLIRAVDMVISAPAEWLSIGDFYYVLMWLRIHSFPKTPLVVSWTCQEKVLTNKKDGSFFFNDGSTIPEDADLSEYEFRECGTHNSELIHMSDIEIITLDDDFEPLLPGFDFPRASHIEDIRAAVENPETRFLASAAQWVAGATFKERLATLEAQMDLDMFDTASILNERADHGVKEHMTIMCRHCRYGQPYTVTIDALSFFR